MQRQATTDDLQSIKKLLAANQLPTDDCHEHLANFVVIEQADAIIAVGGLEVCADLGLIRSIVVSPQHRGKGLAKDIYQLLTDKARRLGINKLYLLTESAADYFAGLGFTVQQRAQAPEPITKTKQFSSLCPASATVMALEL